MAAPRGFAGTQQALGASAVCWVEYQSVVHSQTLPIMSYTPLPLTGKARTGEVRAKPSVRSLSSGKLPCQVLAMCLPAGVNSSPQANSAPSRPPRAANSHSASVGSFLPADVAALAVGPAPVGAEGEAPPLAPVAQVDRLLRLGEDKTARLQHVRQGTGIVF